MSMDKEEFEKFRKISVTYESFDDMIVRKWQPILDAASVLPVEALRTARVLESVAEAMNNGIGLSYEARSAIGISARKMLGILNYPNETVASIDRLNQAAKEASDRKKYGRKLR